MSYDGASNLSSDEDLSVYEQNITAFLPEGESVFAIQHEAAREAVLRYLLRRFPEDFRDSNNRPCFTTILYPEKLKPASCFYALFLIYNAQVNLPGDLYDSKQAEYYFRFLRELGNLALEVDLDGDGRTDRILADGSIRLER